MNHGLITLELLLALAIATASLATMSVLVFSNQNLASDLETKIIALNQAEVFLAKLRAAAHRNFAGIVATTTTSGLFEETITPKLLDNYTKKISWQLTWPRFGQTAGLMTLTTYLTDWETAAETKLCPPADPARWHEPALYGTVNIDPTTTPNTIGTALAARGRFVYLSADSPTKSKPDFFIIDVNDRDQPKILSRLNTGPGLTSLARAGNFVYAGNTSINAQLQVINISDPLNPLLAASYKLPGNYNDSDTVTNTLFYYHQTIYLGTKKSQIAELHIIDVTNPYQPNEIGSFEAGTTINRTFVRDGVAFLATPSDPELTLLDIRNPSQPEVIGGFDTPGTVGNGKSLAVDGNTVNLGRTIGNDEWYVFDVASTSQIATLAHTNLNTSVNDILVRGRSTFLATIDGSKEFQVWDTGDLNSYRLVGSADFPARAVAIDCDGETDLLYAALASSDALRIIGPTP